MVQALIDNNVEFHIARAFSARARWPPNLQWDHKKSELLRKNDKVLHIYLYAPWDRMSHHVCSRHRTRYLSLRYHHQRMMKHCVQQQTHDNHRLVFAEFVDKKSCARRIPFVNYIKTQRQSREWVLVQVKSDIFALQRKKLNGNAEMKSWKTKTCLREFERRDAITNTNKVAFHSPFFPIVLAQTLIQNATRHAQTVGASKQNELETFVLLPFQFIISVCGARSFWLTLLPQLHKVRIPVTSLLLRICVCRAGIREFSFKHINGVSVSCSISLPASINFY